jgi:hypothetical protein
MYAGGDNSRCRIFITREDESDPIRLRRAGRELTNDFERWPVLCCDRSRCSLEIML